MGFDRDLFLPVSRDDMARRGWEDYDILIITGDAYVDHPSFGPTIIGRVLEAEGYRVAVLSQPDWRTPEAFAALGRPRLAVMISAGNLDSMVAHYTAARKRRHDDAYSPGRLLPRAEGRSAPRPRHGGVLQPGAGGVRGHPRDHRRPGGQPAAVRPLRLLGGQGAPLYPL